MHHGVQDCNKGNSTVGVKPSIINVPCVFVPCVRVCVCVSVCVCVCVRVRVYNLTCMCSIALSTTWACSRVTVQPPKPPPVIRLPYTPFTSMAADTSSSSSLQLTS